MQDFQSMVFLVFYKHRVLTLYRERPKTENETMHRKRSAIKTSRDLGSFSDKHPIESDAFHILVLGLHQKTPFVVLS